MIRLFDGNNHVHVTLQTDTSGLTFRSLVNEVEFSKDVIVYVWDGQNSLHKRRELYPDYKAHREPPADTIYEGMKLIKGLLNYTKAIQIEVPGVEADDVIANLAMHYVFRDQVEIVSQDADFAQLPQVKLSRQQFKVKPRWVRLYKACVGDKSDNIPGIGGFGQQTWDAQTPNNLRTLEKVAQGDEQLIGRPPPEIADTNLPTRVKNWFAEDGNLELFRTFYKVVGFLDVSMQEIEAHTTVGRSCPEAVDVVLQEVMQ